MPTMPRGARRGNAYAHDGKRQNVDCTLFVLWQEDGYVVTSRGSHQDQPHQGDEQLKGAKVTRLIEPCQNWETQL